MSSRRVCGLADIQLSGKREAKQARPLSVKEAQDLHRVASCSTRHLVDRIVASHLLLMMYCRCRHSDTLAVEDVLHDHSEGAGYVQLRTKYHKGSKSAARKSLLLPIVGSSAGVGSPSWVQSPVMVGDSEDGQPARRRSARSPTDASPSTSIRYPVECTASYIYRDHCDAAFAPWGV